MTLFFTYDGSDLGNTTVRLEGGLQVTAAADGTIASAAVTIDDPTGALSLTTMQQFSITETACSSQRLFTGYIYNIRQDRGPFVNGAGRVWTLEIADLNFLLHTAVLRGSSAKRPLESGNARMTWLLSQIVGTVADNGLVGANPWMFDEADYRGRYPNEVLPDLCVSSSGTTGRIFFVYWDQAASEAALFMDLPATAVNNSTLRLSNVLTDVDDTTTFAPYRNSEIGIVGEEVYCGVYFTYKGTSIYRHSSTTHAAFFDTFHRDGVFSTDRIGNPATAILHADQFLAAHAGEVDEITCLVKLPASKVNLIDAGMRIQAKFSHLRGYTSFTQMRVQRRTVLLTPGTNEFYDVQLVLSTKGRDPLGGGAPGDFPHTVTPPSIVQQSAGRGNRTMASSITAGDTLVYVGSRRGGAFATLAGLGYTEVRAQVVNGGGDGVGMFYKVAGASESTTLTMTGDGDIAGTWFELPGTWTPSTSASTTGSTVNLAVGPITVAANAFSVTIAGQGRGGAYDSVAASLTFTPGSGWTEDLDTSVVAGHPSVFAAHRFDSGSITGNATNSGNGGLSGTDYDWGMQIASFVGAVTNEPPSQGQWVYNDLAVMAGAVGTLDYGYATGSLRIRVDGVPISSASITETNPAAGTFTLSWAPDSDEVVRVDYQGI